MRQTEGSCTIQEFAAFVGGNPVGYFRFPFSPSQITTTQYAPVATTYGTGATPAARLNVANFAPLSIPGAVPTPNIYIFDPPFPSTGNCVAPSGYTYDIQAQYRDAVRFDQQGHIFTSLPSANYGIGSNPTWTYTPLVAQVPVTSNGEPCQDIKSEYTVLNRNGKDVTVPKGPDRADGSPTGMPDGNYLALAMIDPGATVFKFGEGVAPNFINRFGITHQRWGWFNQYLVGYLEGGYIPVSAGTPRRMVTQRLYYPRFTGTPAVAANLGAGNDVMQFSRGQAGYSPVCQVVSYDPAGATPPRNAATIEAPPFSLTLDVPPAPAPGGPITPTFVFCLQVP